jgi:hypothetical protein
MQEHDRKKNGSCGRAGSPSECVGRKGEYAVWCRSTIALLTGFLTCVVTAFFGSLVALAGVVYWHTDSDGLGIQIDYCGIESSNLNLFIISVMVYSFAAFLGGYVAARLARRAEILNAVIISGVFLIRTWQFSDKIPLWYNLCASTSLVAFAIVGGYLAQKRRLKQSTSMTP